MDIFCFVPQTKCLSLYILTKSGILSALIEFVFFFFPTESFQVIVQTVHTHTHTHNLTKNGKGCLLIRTTPPTFIAPCPIFFLVPSDPVLRYEAVKCPNVAAIFFFIASSSRVDILSDSVGSAGIVVTIASKMAGNCFENQKKKREIKEISKTWKETISNVNEDIQIWRQLANQTW